MYKYIISYDGGFLRDSADFEWDYLTLMKKLKKPPMTFLLAHLLKHGT